MQNTTRTEIFSIGLLLLLVAAISRAEAERSIKSQFESATANKMEFESATKKKISSDLNVEILEQKGLGKPIFPEAKDVKTQAQTASEMCGLYEGKVIAFAGVTALIEDCKQRVVEDVQVLNDLVIDRKLSVLDVPAVVIRTLPFGKPFEAKDAKKNSISKKDLCEKMEGRYVTTDADSFFFVEKCARRPFVSYLDFTHHNVDARPVLAATQDEVESLPIGAPMSVKTSDESNLLYKIDGDIYWSKLFPSGKVDRQGPDTLQKIERIGEERARLGKLQELCSRYEGKIVSFYSQLFLIEKCKRRSLQNMSLDVQASLIDDFGPQDLSAEQYRAIPEGEVLDGEAFFKREKPKKS